MGGDFIFPNSLGGPLDRHNLVLRFFHPGLKAAGLPTVSFHSLRHSVASHLVNERVPITTVQEILGHARNTVTDIYCHPSEESHREAASISADLVLGSKAQAKNTAVI